MSETQETPATPATEKKPAKNFVMLDDVAQLADGIPSYDKTAFRVYGQKNGVRFTVPRTQKIGRAYFYGEPVPEHPSIKKYTAEERGSTHLGGITAAVNFELGSASALEAIKLLTQAVRSAPPPTKLERKSKKEPDAGSDSVES